LRNAEVQLVEIHSKKLRVGISVAGLAALLWSAAPAAVSDEVAGQITASTGKKLSGTIADGERVRLGEDGACSILLDDDAVVELCGEAVVAFQRDRDSNRRIVSLESGEIRIVVEPREFENRIEIHTPAAIATLLGTIVYVSVDPKTGETTITSAQSEVSVRSDQPSVVGTTVLTAGEQVRVEPGEAPPARPRRLDAEQISELGGCLVDFHSAAADRDSRVSGERVTDRLTAFDAANAGSLAGTAPSDRPGGSPREQPADPLTGQEGVCVATDCEFDPATSKVIRVSP
jgi:ferric-dicitrate binding protein FerR (iron transport regulator)